MTTPATLTDTIPTIDALAAENAVLKNCVADLEVEVERAAIWAAHLSLHLHVVKRKAEAFVKGAGLTTWKTNEPRIIGFKLEFDELVDALVRPEPTLPSAEAIRAVIAEREEKQ